MNEPVRRRVPSELLKRGYSDEELAHIYELGRFSLENGDLHRGEAIVSGLCEIAPDYAPAWLGLAYVHIQNKNFDSAVHCARSALRADPELVEAALYLISCLLSMGDFAAAGTYLGEIREKIDSGRVLGQDLVRLYKMQLARYQSR